MTKHVPTPVAAALGLVPTVLDSVRSIPGKVVQLPVLAVSGALTGLDATRRGYDDLAERGERLIARLRGTSFDEFEDAVEDALKGTALAKPYDAVEDALEDVAEAAKASGTRALRAVRSTGATAGAAVQEGADAVSEATGKTAAKAEKAAEGLTAVSEEAARPAKKASAKAPTSAEKAAASTAKAARSAKGAVGDLASDLAEAAATTTATTAESAAEQSKGAPTPKATQPDSTRIGTAAAPEAVAAAEEATAQAGSEQALDHDELPLADYDHMTLGSLRGRLRSLSVEQLVQVRTYEKAHADRLPVVTMLDNRIAKLSSDASAEPTGNTDAPVGELRESQIGAGGSKIDPATSAPVPEKPAHGVPGPNRKSR